MKLLSNVIEARNKYCKDNKIPLLLKISPDLTEQDKKDIADVVNDKKVILFLSTKEVYKLFFFFVSVSC
jgi:dihydroorotate dehydrogenase